MQAIKQPAPQAFGSLPVRHAAWFDGMAPALPRAFHVNVAGSVSAVAVKPILRAHFADNRSDEMSKDNSISALIAQLDASREMKHDEKRIYKPAIEGVVEDQYFDVRPNFEYPQRLEWTNWPDMPARPRPDDRYFSGRSVNSIADPELKFPANAVKLIDYYAINSNCNFVSDRFADFVEQHAPGTIERRRVKIKARDGVVDYNLVIPRNMIEAVDTDRTAIEIRAFDRQDGNWIFRARMIGEPVFDPARTAGCLHFTDPDNLRWYWSRQLIDAAKAAGLRGMRFGPILHQYCEM